MQHKKTKCVFFFKEGGFSVLTIFLIARFWHHWHFQFPKFDNLENESLFKSSWWLFMCQNVNIIVKIHSIPKLSDVRDRQNWCGRWGWFIFLFVCFVFFWFLGFFFWFLGGFGGVFLGVGGGEAVQSRAMTTFPESRHNYPEQYFWSFGRWICLHSSLKGWYIDILSPIILDITTQCTHSYTGGHHAGESLPVKHWRFGLRQRRPFWKKNSHFAIWERTAQVIFHNSYINWLNEGWKWFFSYCEWKIKSDGVL